jgi:hypothetical protein
MPATGSSIKLTSSSAPVAAKSIGSVTTAIDMRGRFAARPDRANATNPYGGGACAGDELRQSSPAANALNARRHIVMGISNLVDAR